MKMNSCRFVGTLTMLPTLTLEISVNAEEVITSWSHWGWCPQLPDPVGDFDIVRYMGTWYQIRVDKDCDYLIGDECVHTRYTYHPQDWWYRLFWLVNVNNGKYVRDSDEVTNCWLFGDFGKAMNWTKG